MSREDSQAFGKWAWIAALTTLGGYGGIVLTVALNAATLFEYNGKRTGNEPRELTGAEAAIVLEFLLLAAAVAVALWNAAGARRPGAFRWWHAIPLTVAGSAFLMALLATTFAARELLF